MRRRWVRTMASLPFAKKKYIQPYLNPMSTPQCRYIQGPCFEYTANTYLFEVW